MPITYHADVVIADLTLEDANVLYQDTVRVYRELLKAGKEVFGYLFV